MIFEVCFLVGARVVWKGLPACGVQIEIIGPSSRAERGGKFGGLVKKRSFAQSSDYYLPIPQPAFLRSVPPWFPG